MAGSLIGIVIPALNEAATIVSVVERVRAAGTPVVVDDGSIDKTGELARAAGAEVVRHEQNRGYDQALDTGFARARELGCDYIITMDADGQHDPLILADFIRALREGADVVLGVRDRRQRIGESIFGWVAAWKWGIRDPLCGMKAYRVEVFRRLGHFDSYGSIGTELTLYAAKRGLKISQVPVKTRDRLDSPRFGRRFSANRRILRAMFIGLFSR